MSLRAFFSPFENNDLHLTGLVIVALIEREVEAAVFFFFDVAGKGLVYL